MSGHQRRCSFIDFRHTVAPLEPKSVTTRNERTPVVDRSQRSTIAVIDGNDVDSAPNATIASVTRLESQSVADTPSAADTSP